MVASTCFGITLPSSGSVPSTSWEMLNWGAVDRIWWMGVLGLVTWCVHTTALDTGVFHRGKAVEAWRWPHATAYSSKIGMSGSIPSLPPYAIMAQVGYNLLFHLHNSEFNSCPSATENTWFSATFVGDISRVHIYHIKMLTSVRTLASDCVSTV
jgi:hypothetical protein